MINEKKMTKKHAKQAIKLLKPFKSVENVVPKGDVLFVAYSKYNDRTKIIKQLEKLYRYDNDGRSTNAPRIMGVAGYNWISFVARQNESVNEMSKLAKKHGKFGGTGVPFPTEEPNEFAYIDFKKWAKKMEKKIKKQMSILKDDRIFRAMEFVWQTWDKKANDGAFSNIKGNKFGRALVKMMWKDGIVFDKKSNKIVTIKESTQNFSQDGEPDTGFIPKGKKRTLGKKKGTKPDAWYDGGGYEQVDFPKADDIYGKGNKPDLAVKKSTTPTQDPKVKKFSQDYTLAEGLHEASKIWQRLDKVWKLRDEAMDVEENIIERTKELKQLYMDMEQEAEPGGGPIANRYGKQIDKLEKILKKDKAILKTYMKKIDKLESY